MRVRRIIDGEPQFGQGRQDFLQGVYAVAQVIQTSLQLYKGEWWEDQNDGLPLWTQMISASGSNTEKFNSMITNRILGIKLGEIKLVESMSNVTKIWNGNLRKYSYTGTAKSIYGYITVTNGG